MKVAQVFIIAILVFTWGCMHHDSSSSSNEPSGILEGKVTIGPIFPHERIGVSNEAPPEVYQAHKLVVLAEDGTTKVKEAALDGTGRFNTKLAPGNYVLDVEPHDIGMRVWKVPRNVTIQSGQTTTFNFDIDTGIR